MDRNGKVARGLNFFQPMSGQETRGCVRSNLSPTNEWTGVERLRESQPVTDKDVDWSGNLAVADRSGEVV
jgi:hypothetical protein